MLSQIWIVSALCACAFAAPTHSSAGAVDFPADVKVLTEYFRLLGKKIQEGKNMAAAPVCDLSNAKMPESSPTLLPPVGEGLYLKHVAIGRGTQNYTCDTQNATAIPVATGAVATLYNASCIAATYPEMLATLPDVALQFNLTNANQSTISPSNLVISGHHFFSNGTTPVFVLNPAGNDIGVAPCQKNSAVPAPAGTTKGQGNQGFGTVAWLKLDTRHGATGGLQEVYRINTAGGSPPPTCMGMAASFQVQYAAEYWFYAV
ncbi:hypothetical protein WAI453_001417 [Rhynchosporium graminicola]|uniref:Malate dehydrogenase n=1 Tax=Rhynchosporium graminicola TaxID=2792576 RepID=A0A1E1LGV7_9HELO|nr:uncharacterized protein RCO7_09836 [Rhynchosporium commune]